VFEALFAVSNLIEHGDIDLPLNFERAVGGMLVTPALHRFHHTRAAWSATTTSERSSFSGTDFSA
jgi:hypothetical protein